MTNIDGIREYRRASDAAEGARIAEGLREVVNHAHVIGEISTVAACEAWTHLDQIAEEVGTNVKALERKATRLRDKLVKDNLALVWRVAKRTLGARGLNPANLEEAVQEGSIGLVRAIEEFDETRGSFSTCAAYWIRHHVQNCMHHQVDFAKQRSACMPPAVVREVTKFRLQHGREPEPHEIVHKGVPVTAEQWARWTETTYVQSVDEMAADGHDDGDGYRAAEIIADPETNPDALTARANMHEKIETALAEMSPRNRDMSRKLFLDGDTLTEVADFYGLSVERVRELKGSLEKRLRKVLTVAA